MNNKWLQNKYLRLLAMSVVIVIALTFIQDFGDFLDEHSDKIVKLGVNQQCDPTRGICSASIVNNGEFQRISFAIQGTTAAGNDFTISINATGFDFEGIQSVAVSFEMEGETIENNRVLLQPDRSDNLVVPEKWHTMVKLPPAPEGRNDWLAVVRLKSSKREYRAEFPFSQR